WVVLAEPEPKGVSPFAPPRRGGFGGAAGRPSFLPVRCHTFVHVTNRGRHAPPASPPPLPVPGLIEVPLPLLLLPAAVVLLLGRVVAHRVTLPVRQGV